MSHLTRPGQSYGTTGTGQSATIVAECLIWSKKRCLCVQICRVRSGVRKFRLLRTFWWLYGLVGMCQSFFTNMLKMSTFGDF